MKPQVIIAVILAIAMTACVLFWVLPNKSQHEKNNHHLVQSVEMRATNTNGGTFTFRLAGMIVNGTNVPITNGNVRFTIDPKDK